MWKRGRRQKNNPGGCNKRRQGTINQHTSSHWRGEEGRIPAVGDAVGAAVGDAVGTAVGDTVGAGETEGKEGARGGVVMKHGRLTTTNNSYYSRRRYGGVEENRRWGIESEESIVGSASNEDRTETINKSQRRRSKRGPSDGETEGRGRRQD